MSERGTWMTDFIYCGETVTALREYFQAERCPDNKYFTVQDLFEHQHCGAFCGRIGGMYPGEELHSMEELVPEIKQIIKTPIRICVFAEDGSQIFEIEPAGDDGQAVFGSSVLDNPEYQRAQAELNSTYRGMIDGIPVSKTRD